MGTSWHGIFIPIGWLWIFPSLVGGILGPIHKQTEWDLMGAPTVLIIQLPPYSPGLWDQTEMTCFKVWLPVSSPYSHRGFLLCFFSFFFFLILFIFWLLWVFVAVHGLSLVAASKGYSLLWCAGFSLPWLFLLQSTGSRPMGFSSCGTQALERVGFSSCGTWVQ